MYIGTTVFAYLRLSSFPETRKSSRKATYYRSDYLMSAGLLQVEHGRAASTLGDPVEKHVNDSMSSFHVGACVKPASTWGIIRNLKLKSFYFLLEPQRLQHNGKSTLASGCPGISVYIDMGIIMDYHFLMCKHPADVKSFMPACAVDDVYSHRVGCVRLGGSSIWTPPLKLESGPQH